MRKFNIAMLSGQAPDEVIIVSQESHGHFVEDALARASQHYNGACEIQQAIQNTDDVALEALEEHSALKQSLARGGTEPVAMEALQRAVKRFEKRTGVAYKTKYLAVESFEARDSRLQSTKVAMEATMEYVRKLLKMLSDAITGVWGKIKSYFDELMIGAERLVKRATKLQADLEKVKDKQVAEDNVITYPSVLEFTRKDNKVVEGEDFVKEYSQHVKSSISHRSADSDFVKNWIAKNKYQEILEESRNEGATEKLLGLIVSDQGPSSEDSKGGLHEVQIKGELLGDFVISETLIAKNSTWEELSKNYNKISNKIEKPTSTEGLTVKSAIVLTPEQSESILANAIELMGSFKALREQIQLIDSEVKRIASETKLLDDNKLAPADQLMVASGYVRTHANAMMDKLATQRGYDVNLTKAALDYVAASIDQLS